MLNMKKTLVIGTVLTAFCASAFAANADTQPEKPSMSERVNAILHETDGDRPCPPPGNCPPPGERKHHDRRGPQLTPTQRAEREKMRAEWEKMTPEQRQKAFEKHQQEREKERKERHEKHAKETMAKLTPSQKAEVEQFIKDDMAQRKDMGERLHKMTPEQREAVKANKPMPPKKFDKHHKDIRHDGPRDLKDGDRPCPPPPPAGAHHGGPRDWKDGDRPCPPPPPPTGAHHGGPHHNGDFPPPPPADEK